jgi:predicted SnoaL-like aldol condensation-catalyzing enzyme
MGAGSDVVQRLTDEVFLKGDLSHWDELFDDKFVDHDPMPGMADDKKGQREIAEIVVAGYTNRRMRFHELSETSDGRVVENWRMDGTHTGDLFGIPPSNEEGSVRGMELWRVADGKIVEHWGVIDVSELLANAGLIPPS